MDSEFPSDTRSEYGKPHYVLGQPEYHVVRKKCRKVKQKKDKVPSSRLRPKIITWKDTKIIRQHSFIAPVKEIITWSEELDVTRVGIIGDMNSGKTTMANAIAHVIHTYSKIDWAIRHFDEDDLLDFEATLATLKPANYIMTSY